MEVELGKSYGVHRKVVGRPQGKRNFPRGYGKSEKANATTPKGSGNGNNRVDSACWHNLKGCRLPIGVQHGNKAESEILKER